MVETTEDFVLTNSFAMGFKKVKFDFFEEHVPHNLYHYGDSMENDLC